MEVRPIQAGPDSTMILSVHIPKTAGVSVRNILKEHFGAGFVLYYWEPTDAYGRVLPAVPDSAECVHGHFPADQFAGRFPEARLVTWVRDPVERVASSYYYRLRHPDWRHPVCRELHAKKLSLADYAALPLVRNEMVRFFGGKQPADFFFIGVMEEFARSLARMSSLLGLPAAPERHDNGNPDKKTSRYEIDPGVRREIEELNEGDAELYGRCLDQADWLCTRAGCQRMAS
ncbi:MAG: sulfotransferase family 2 domain-containing protein [Opitutae bacterium]|nr:sulfotransferase family 2 domain-containing protein [Opitutae bacterium]